MLMNSQATGSFQGNPLRDFQRELNASLMEFRNGLMATQGALSMNLWQAEGEVILRLEVPGVDPEDLEIDVQGDRVKILAGRNSEETPESDQLIKQERRFGDVEREIQLPFKIEASRTEASCHKGILELKLYRSPEEQPHRVEVKSR